MAGSEGIRHRGGFWRHEKIELLWLFVLFGAAWRRDMMKERDLTERNEKTSHKYDDIIHMEYPRPDRDVTRHPPMAISDRAKIFAPFAALKGYDESIQEKTEKHML